MRRALVALAAAALLAVPAVEATVMPYPTAVILLEPTPLSPANRARFNQLVERLGEDEYLEPVPPLIAVGPVKACARLAPAQREPCVRRILSRRTGQPMVTAHVAVIAVAAPGGKLRLTCIGPGKAMRHPKAQRDKLVDVTAALSSDRRFNAFPRRDAGECIYVAAEERYPAPPGSYPAPPGS